MSCSHLFTKIYTSVLLYVRERGKIIFNLFKAYIVIYPPQAGAWMSLMPNLDNKLENKEWLSALVKQFANWFLKDT